MSDLCLAGASHWAPFDSRRRQTARRRALRVLRTWRREPNSLIKLFAMFTLTTALVGPVSAATVEVGPFGERGGKVVYALALAGDIKSGDDLRVASLLGKALVEDRFPGFMVLSSNGGNTNASLGIARIAHDYGMPVLVRAQCLSGCAIIALSAWRGRVERAQGGLGAPLIVAGILTLPGTSLRNHDVADRRTRSPSNAGREFGWSTAQDARRQHPEQAAWRSSDSFPPADAPLIDASVRALCGRLVTCSTISAEVLGEVGRGAAGAAE